MVGFLMVFGSIFLEKSGDTSQDVQEDQVDEEDELYTQVKGNFLQLPACVTWKKFHDLSEAQRELHELNCADLRDLCEERTWGWWVVFFLGERVVQASFQHGFLLKRRRLFQFLQ